MATGDRPINYVVNELLCTLKSQFGKYPRDNIIATFTEFYIEKEIIDAKKMILEMADKCIPKLDDLKKIKARVGDGKLKRDIEDVLNVYTLLDAKKASLPPIFASDASRIPSFMDFEMSKMADSIKDTVLDVNKAVSEQIAQFNTQLNASIASKFSEITTSVTTQIEEIKKSMTSHLPDAVDCMSTRSSVFGSSIAGQIDEMKSVKCDISDVLTLLREHVKKTTDSVAIDEPIRDEGLSLGWSTIVNGRAMSALSGATPFVATTSTTLQPSLRKVVGSKKIDGGKLSASSVGQWHVFIGRIGKDTEEGDIKEFLEDSGVTVTSVYKLKATQPWQEKSAAFHVTVAIKCKDSIMDPMLWPDNVEVRDWFFKPR